MTAATVDAPAQRLRDVVAAEAMKGWTRRPQRLLWAAAVVGGLAGAGTALFLTDLLAAVGEGLPAGELPALVDRAPTAGAVPVALVLGLAAIHLSAGEWVSGRHLLAALAVPDRRRTLAGRLTVVAALAMTLAALTFTVCALAVAGFDAARGLGEAGPERTAAAVAVTSVATTLVVVLAACLGWLVRHGVAAAGLWLALLVALPAVLNSVAVTARIDALAWTSAMLPAGRLGAVLDSLAAGDAGAATGAVAALAGWAVAGILVAFAATRSAPRVAPPERVAP